MKLTTLSNLNVGQQAEILDICETCPLKNRLLEMGLLPETPVKKVQKGLFNDPCCYEICGTTIALRNSEAKMINCKIIELDLTNK